MDSRIIETAIGVVVVWLVASMAVSAVVEAIAKVLRLRAGALETELRRWVAESPPDQVKPFTELVERTKRAPVTADTAFDAFVQKIDPRVDAAARRFTRQELDATTFAYAVQGVTTGRIIAVVERIQASVGDDAKAAQQQLERWFDGRMADLSAQYKRWSRWIAAGVGIVLAYGTGIDSFGIATRLYEQPELRASFGELAERIHEERPAGDPCPAPAVDPPASTTTTLASAVIRADLTCAQDLVAELTDLKIVPEERNPSRGEFWRTRTRLLPGIAATALAVSFGAPFWFANLKRLMGLRRKTS